MPTGNDGLREDPSRALAAAEDADDATRLRVLEELYETLETELAASDVPLERPQAG